MSIPTEDEQPGALEFGRIAWLRLLVLCSAVLLEGMSLSSVSIQLSAIQHELDLPPEQLQLVASMFLATYAGFLLVAGTCADHWGARQTFLAGASLFGLASVAATFAQSGPLLIAARGVQGIGAAVTTPSAVALIASEFPTGSARNRALGALSASGAAGFCFGVVVGGLLTDRLGWRWAFALYVPLAALIVLVAPRIVTARTGQAATRIPWVASLLVTGGLIAIVYAAGRAGSAPLTEVAAVAIGGCVLLGGFVAVQRGARGRLVPRRLMGDRRLVAACIALGGAFAGITGAMLLVATELQDRRAYSPLAAGLAFLPQGLAVGLLSPLFARLVARYSVPRLVLVGLAVIVLGQLGYLRVHGSGYLGGLFPATILVGSGIALLYPAATSLAVSAASTGEQGIASGVLTTCQQIGGALGVAVSVGVQVGLGETIPSAGLCACAGFTGVALALCWLTLPTRSWPVS